jgi:hypothetical protein
MCLKMCRVAWCCLSLALSRVDTYKLAAHWSRSLEFYNDRVTRSHATAAMPSRPRLDRMHARPPPAAGRARPRQHDDATATRAVTAASCRRPPPPVFWPSHPIDPISSHASQLSALSLSLSLSSCCAAIPSQLLLPRKGARCTCAPDRHHHSLPVTHHTHTRRITHARISLSLSHLSESES